MKVFLKIFSICIVFAAFALLLILFFPRTHDTLNFTARPGTQFWDLPTGSRIGYTYLAKKSNYKNYPIIFLHGGPGGFTADETIKLYAPLSTTHDLYFYDQIGSGHSSRLKEIKEYHIDRHIQDLDAIMELLDAEKVILIGHSWGAILATKYAAEHPDKIYKTILTGPGPILPIDWSLAKITPPDSLQLLKPKFSNAQANEKMQSMRIKLINRWARAFKQKLATDEEVDAYFTLLNSELKRSTVCDGSSIAPAAIGGGYYAHIMTVNSFNECTDYRSLLKQADLDVLILRGQCDNQKWGFMQEYLSLIPDIQLNIIEGSGHSMTIEHQDIVLKLIENFLGD